MCESVKVQWLLQWKLIDLTVKNIFHSFNQRKLTDLIVKNIFHWFNQQILTDVTVRNIFSVTQSAKINWLNSEKYFFGYPMSGN